MTPKKIYISESTAQKQLPSNGVSIGLRPLYSDDICYILESEHNRLVDELKAELSTSNDLLKMTLEVSEFKTTEIDRLKAEIDKLKFDLDYVSGVANDLLDSGKWISVKERLPNKETDGEKVLIYREIIGMSISLMDSVFVKNCDKSSFWMTLPKPPIK